MNVILASPRGFCAGVNRALTTLCEVIRQSGTPLYVFHEIVHNTWVVRNFREQGVVFVNTLNEVPDGACVMISAHGVSPRVRQEAKQKKLRIIDATCPLVAHIHHQARLFSEEGFQIVLIGHAGHDEIVGITEEAPDSIHVLCSLEEAECLTVEDPDRIAYLTQTTLSVEETAEIVAVLKRRFPKIRQPQPNCICFATQNRQRAVRELVSEADIVLVVGSRTSSNSRRLRELALKRKVPAYLVDGVADLQSTWFSESQTVLVTAGASAPETVVQSIVEFLQKTFSATVETRQVCVESLQFQLPDFS